MTAVEAQLRVAAADLKAIDAQWALIGGMAVAFRAQPRSTMDLDFAVAVADDGEAENVVYRLRDYGYHPGVVMDHQNYTERMSTVRLVSTRGRSDVIVDLLFASSGIEPEIVDAADMITVLPRVTVPLATTAHLISMKSLAGRQRDLMDLDYLFPVASDADIDRAREATRLIAHRGYHRDQDVVAILEEHIRKAGR